MANDLEVDSLFVGLTRPPMLFGVTYMVVVVNALIGMIGYIATTEFKYLVLIFPLHAVGYYVCSKEPLFLELFKVRAEKCSRCRNRMHHGANSYDQY